MSDCRKYVDYIMEQAKNLLAIDSPSGYGREASSLILAAGIRKTESCWRPTATPWEAWLPRLRKTAG